MNDIKIISFDLDGTLLDEDKKIPEESVQWIREFQQNGGFVVLSTGRKISEIQSYILQLQLQDFYKGFVITSSGAYLHFLGKNNFTKFKMLNSVKSSQIISKIMSKSSVNQCTIVTDSFDYIVKKDYQPIDFIKNIILKIRRSKQIFISQNSITSIIDDIEKIMINTTNREAVKIALSGETGIYTRLIDRNRMEVYPTTIDKSIALKYLLNLLNISHKQLLIFGDDENDLSCFEEFENCVAMGNAVKSIKRIAKFSTLTNIENGVYNFLKQHL